MLFLNSSALTEFVGIKVKIFHESFALKKRDKTSPSQFRFSQVTEKFRGVVEASSSYRALVP